MKTSGLTPNAAHDEQFDPQTTGQSVENSSISAPEETISSQVAPESSDKAESAPSAEAHPQAEAPQNDSDTPAEALAEALADEVATPDEAADTISEEAENSETTEDKKCSDSNNYSNKSRAELVELLMQAIETRAAGNLRNVAEAIKVAFYKIPREDVEAQKAAFVEAGGAAEDFVVPSDQIEDRFKEAMTAYRAKRDSYMASIEEEKASNMALKMAIIDELKELVNGSETLNNTFNSFRELQNRWREIGAVPQEKVKDLWDTYHYHVENFYNFVKINKELRDMDLKRNLESKIQLCEEAEALVLDPSPTAAFHSLQKLHQQWREVGPVAIEFKEQIWNRFKDASAKVNKRHQEYFDQIKDEQLRNLALKEELCVKVEALVAQPCTTRKEWTDASDEITEIQKIWKTIGFAPRKDNTKIYERFRTACDRFFEAKREFFSGVKGEMDDNLQVKVELCIQAEALAESDDWKKTTDAIIELQKRWKETGATSRKQAEAVWKRFRAACDRFFERKAEHFNSVDAKFVENFEAKRALLDELQSVIRQEAKITFETLKEYQRRWSEIGFVPLKQKEAIAKEYKEVIDQMFAMLRGDERQRKIENFRGKLSALKDSGARRLNSERERLLNKMRQVEADIQLWENNIGFFAKSKNAEVLVAEVRKKIERAKAEINETLEKIRMVESQDQAPVATPAASETVMVEVIEVVDVPAAEPTPAVTAENAAAEASAEAKNE